MKRLHDYSLRWNLLLVPVVATLCFAAYLIYSSLVLSNGNALLKNIRDSYFPILDAASDNLNSYENILEALKTAAATGELNFLTLAQTKANEIISRYETLDKLDVNHKTEIERLKSRFTQFFPMALGISRQMATKSDIPNTLELKKMQQLRNEYLSGAENYKNIAEKEFHDTVNSAIDKSEQAKELGAVIGVFMLLMIAALTWFVSRGIRTLEKRVADRNKKLAVVNNELEMEIQKLKAAEEAKSQAERRIISFSEDTQQHIGQELHDDLGQLLTGIAFMTEVLSNKLEKQGFAESHEAKKITAYINEAIFKTRTLAHGLYPVELKEAGLAAMLSKLARNTESMYQITCNFRADGEHPIKDQLIVINLFRIAQEAVNNAIKHGNSTIITLKLSIFTDLIKFEVNDNGSGIKNISTNDTNKGLGMQSMQYRATLLGGNFQIKALANGGTGVAVSLNVR
jgi:signal transduction histidine kinase